MRIVLLCGNGVNPNENAAAFAAAPLIRSTARFPPRFQSTRRPAGDSNHGWPMTRYWGGSTCSAWCSPRSMISGVTKMNSLRFSIPLPLRLKKKLMMGMSPRMGTVE